ncbi:MULTISPECIES: TRAP transporter small permease [Marinimicrobium]|uniref:TRAP transporter small permease n=1 Tax=Marinimicrobium TaxID=359337 RepID=UPI0006865004|nr:TRAP transporter small permease subunit [Marinimicrobium agarilyticum]
MNSRSAARIHWIDWPALALFVALAAIVLLQFLSRYVLNDSVAWTEEIARYLLIGVAYAGSTTALRKGEHIFLEVIYRRVSLASIKPLAIMVDLVSVVFHAVLTLLAVWLSIEADRRMISVDLPKSIVYWFVAAALFSTTVVAVWRLIQRAGLSSREILSEIDRSAGDEDAV